MSSSIDTFYRFVFYSSRLPRSPAGSFDMAVPPAPAKGRPFPGSHKGLYMALAAAALLFIADIVWLTPWLEPGKYPVIVSLPAFFPGMISFALTCATLVPFLFSSLPRQPVPRPNARFPGKCPGLADAGRVPRAYCRRDHPGRPDASRVQPYRLPGLHRSLRGTCPGWSLLGKVMRRCITLTMPPPPGFSGKTAAIR